MYVCNFTEVQVSRVIIVLLLQNCFVWCKDHTHQAILSRALYEIRSTQKTNMYVCMYVITTLTTNQFHRRTSFSGGQFSPGRVNIVRPFRLTILLSIIESE